MKSNRDKKKIDPNSFQTLDCAKVHPALRDYFSYCFNKTAIRYRTCFEVLFAKHGIIPPQFGILKFLKVTGPLSQMELGAELGVDKATMVKLIDGLEKQKLIKRIGDKKDRRIKLIHIAPKGFQLLEKGVVEAQVIEDHFLSILSPAEKKSLKAIMPKLLDRSIEMMKEIGKS